MKTENDSQTIARTITINNVILSKKLIDIKINQCYLLFIIDHLTVVIPPVKSFCFQIAYIFSTLVMGDLQFSSPQEFNFHLYVCFIRTNFTHKAVLLKSGIQI